MSGQLPDPLIPNPRNALLPPNVTSLEQDLVNTSIGPFDELLQILPTLRNFKYGNTPDDLLSFLIDEYKLGELSPYIQDPRQIIRDGIIWRRKQGTQGAVCLALSWIDRDEIDELLENTKWWHWTNVELRMGEICDFQDVIDAVNLTRLSLPARATLARVWSGEDFPMMVLNECSFLNESLLNKPGGVYDPDLDIWVYINNTRSNVLTEDYDPEVMCELLVTFTTCIQVYNASVINLNNMMLNGPPSEPISYIDCANTSNVITAVGGGLLTMGDFINFKDGRLVKDIASQKVVV